MALTRKQQAAAAATVEDITVHGNILELPLNQGGVLVIDRTKITAISEAEGEDQPTTIYADAQTWTVPFSYEYVASVVWPDAFAPTGQPVGE